MSNRSISLTDSLYQYLLDVSLREPPLLRALREETAQMRQRSMQIAPEQGQFMALLARLVGARRCIEVGVFTGYSSLSVALALPDDGHIVACDVSEEWTSIARRYWKQAGVDRKIELRLAPAVETLDALLADGGEGTFDLAFIDADKDNYSNYWDRCRRLVRRGGVIAVDNVLWGGSVADASNQETSTQAIRALNELVHGDDGVTSVTLPVADGMTIARIR